MNIFVLLKRTFDTEEKISIQNGRIEDDGAEYIINPYDEYAVEEAINKFAVEKLNLVTTDSAFLTSSRRGTD